ncbi:hypothetical protein Bca52824_033425 [Brassica carinata]|uniref:Myrosinase-associated protein n=1 Tax=Brassica carinata TaxID=52824 RepID=A0A8X7SCU5_BRACI|nr:hypothetical protein Bca52824_033425 [Brassica carinata]
MATNSSLASVLGVLFVFTLFHNLITVAGQNLPQVALFTFGDSNFDAGNRKFMTSVSLPQNFWPYGKSRDDPSGKFSDGKIVPDFLAKFMGISHDIPPALKPGADISRGASFAVDSATKLGTPKDSLNLNQQVRRFNQMISSWTEDYIPKSVFMIFVGMEDYLSFIRNNPTADGSAQKSFVDSVTTQLKYNIELLYSPGASKFIVYTLPPLGCLPIVRQEFNTCNDCYEKLNNLAKLHNAKIGPMMNDLATSKPGFQFTVFDFYNAVLRRRQRNLNYRFSFTNISCCAIGTHNAYGCGSPNAHSKLCEYQRSYLYFDGRHHSEKAQESFAHLLFGADPNVIQPMNTRELITHSVNANMSEFWKEPVEKNLLFDHHSVVNARAFM